MYQKVRCSKTPPARSAAYVCFIAEGGKIHADDKTLDQKSDGAMSQAAKRTDVSGDVGETNVVYAKKRAFVMVGIGKLARVNANTMRIAGSRAVATLHRIGATSAHVSFHDGLNRRGKHAELGQAFGEGCGLGAFSFDTFKKLTSKQVGAKSLAIGSGDAEIDSAMRRGLALADSANFARELAATPPNVATTTYIAKQAQQLARKNATLSCSVLKGDALERERLVGLQNVGKASENEPCLIKLTYTPRRKSTGTIVLVGKTITYDTGGLSIKGGNGMKGMKYDKNGGMAVIGAMHAVAQIKPDCKVIALMPTAENSISDEAYRPDDIIEYPNGVTVEVTNTDAEGRLVLADGLAYACRRLKPDAVIDLATLTGGVVVALGKFRAGLWCEDSSLRKRIEAASEKTGELVWRLPLDREYRDMMKSQHADIWNSAPVRHAHPIQGAAFLSYFVDDSVPWAHLDIAGTSQVDSNAGPYSAGPTGFGVRLLAEFLDSWSS